MLNTHLFCQKLQLLEFNCRYNKICFDKYLTAVNIKEKYHILNDQPFNFKCFNFLQRLFSRNKTIKSLNVKRFSRYNC